MAAVFPIGAGIGPGAAAKHVLADPAIDAARICGVDAGSEAMAAAQALDLAARGLSLFLAVLKSAIVALLLSLIGGRAGATPVVLEVAGLKQPAEILVDRWGVPHIYAKNVDDAFFVQGFNAARDRLFQIDLWRRRGLGRLAEVFGPAFVEQDKATRLFSLSWRYESRMGLLLERCTGDCDSFRRWHQCLH